MSARDPISVVVKNILGKLSKYKDENEDPRPIIQSLDTKLIIHRIMHRPKYMVKYKFHFFRNTREESYLEHKPNF